MTVVSKENQPLPKWIKWSKSQGKYIVLYHNKTYNEVCYSITMNKQDRQHIARMEKIMKAIQPFIDEDRSCDYADSWNSSSRIKQAYDTAKVEIKFTKEKYD